MPSPETMRCLGCGYDLRGLPERRCPECGRPFDPSDSSTYLAKRESGGVYLWTAIGAAPLAIVPAIVFRWISPSLDLAGVTLTAMCGLGLLVELSVAIAGSILLVRPRHMSERRPLTALAILISIAVVLVCSELMLKLCLTGTSIP